MEEVIVFCSGGKHLKSSIKEKLKENKVSFVEVEKKVFPDGEIGIRIPKEVSGKKAVIVQSFYPNQEEKIIEAIFAGKAAKQAKAKKVELFAGYFPYLRKDKNFEKRECASAKAIAEIFGFFNKVYIIEPHLHRIKNLKKLGKNLRQIDVHEGIARYLRDVKLKDPVFISPDIESERIVKSVSGMLKKNHVVLRKKRYNPRKVKIDINKKINLENRDLIILDDMISTGNTMIEAIKEAKNFKPRKIYCITVHGIFCENALQRLKDEAVVVSTNSIPSKASIIDISEKIKEVIK